MKLVIKPLLLVVALAGASTAVFSQAAAAGPGAGMMGQGAWMHAGMDHHGTGKMNSARMQARMEKHQTVLKEMLKLSANQEGAWTVFVAAMKPPMEALRRQRPDPAEMAKLTTPERIDKMRALRTQHMSEMSAAADRRGEATKVFYAGLTPEQQRVFDVASVRHFGARMGGPRPGMGPGAAPTPRQ